MLPCCYRFYGSPLTPLIMLPCCYRRCPGWRGGRCTRRSTRTRCTRAVPPSSARAFLQAVMTRAHTRVQPPRRSLGGASDNKHSITRDPLSPSFFRAGVSSAISPPLFVIGSFTAWLSCCWGVDACTVVAVVVPLAHLTMGPALHSLRVYPYPQSLILV